MPIESSFTWPPPGAHKPSDTDVVDLRVSRIRDDGEPGTKLVLYVTRYVAVDGWKQTLLYDGGHSFLLKPAHANATLRAMEAEYGLHEAAIALMARYADWEAIQQHIDRMLAAVTARTT